MENKKQQPDESRRKGLRTPNRYFGLKRLIEIGAMASPLVVVFAVFVAPLIAESVSLLIRYSNRIDFGVASMGRSLLTFGITGLLVAFITFIFVGIQTYYYITRHKRERWILYALGGVLLLVIMGSIIVNSVMLRSGGTIYPEALDSYTTLLQSMIAISLFTLFNIIFMFAWTIHLKSVGVSRVKDTDIMEE